MKILAIGPGQSTIELGYKLVNLDKNITTLGLHRVYPYLKEEFNIDINYWTWGDPEAIGRGIDYIETNPQANIPKMIVPWWYRNINDFSKMIGTSRINNHPKRIEQYHSFLDKYKDRIHYIENAYASRYLTENNQSSLISNPEERFNNNKVILGTVPFDGKHSESNWAQENKFTTAILPISHYLKASEVYCLGFDNRGGRIDSNESQCHNKPPIIKNYMSKLKPWVNEWAGYHNMSIYSVAPNEYTPNNQILEYKPLEELYG